MSIWNRSCHATVASVITIIVASSAPLFAYFGYKDRDIGTTSIKGGDIVNKPCISAFQLDLDDHIEIDASNRALSLIQDTYRQDYYNSSISHHHFVRTAPLVIQETLSEFVWSNSALKQLRTKFSARVTQDATGATSRNNNAIGSIRVIRDVFDEIYIMRPEFDLLDEKKIHYDGNLKIAGICTIRALTYLSGHDAMFVALTSRQNYTTRNHTSIILDFDRELHYVSLNPAPEALVRGKQRPEPRVIIKSAIHVVLPGTHPLVAYLRIILHRTMLFGARSFRRAFESKSGSQLKSGAPSKSNWSMMAIDNIMRSMNKIHMILPLLLIGLPLGAICLAPLLHPFQFFPYIYLIIARCLFHTNQIAQLSWLAIFMACSVLGILMYGSRSFGKTRWNTMTNIWVFRTAFHSSNASNSEASSFSLDLLHVGGFCLVLSHIAWVGVYFYIEANADMANKILLAPWQQVIFLDDIVLKE